jgi:hypothetical protein
MWYFNLDGIVTHLSWSRRRMQTSTFVAVFGLVLVTCTLVSCGSSTTPATSVPSPTPTHVLLSTPTPTPFPSPTPKPTAIPTPVPTATSAPVSPAILDLRPSSMSIVGHLDCQKNGAFVCFAQVLSRPSAQSNLHWFAFTNVPGGIAFHPSSGVLGPGQSVLVTITVPFTACTQGLFFFRGPINTHTITWAC